MPHFSRSSGYRNILDQHSKDITALATLGKLDPVIGRTHEIQKVIQILARRTKNNPILIGKAGVGKTAIVEGLAEAIIAKHVPKNILGKRVLSLDLSSIIAGTKFRGDFEKRVVAIRDALIASERNIILFIDEIHNLAEAGEATGALDADDILKPALARGQLQVIGATTNSEYEQYIANDMTLARRFQLVPVPEPTAVETLQILRGLKSTYEQYHDVIIPDATLQAIVRLSKVRLKDKTFPDKAIDLMDEAASKVKLSLIVGKSRQDGKSKTPTVTLKDIEEVLKG